MKIKKFGAIAAAVLIMTSLAVSASAASLSGDPDMAAKADLRAVTVDVDLSTIDWANIQEGELEAIGTIDPATVSGDTTTVGKDEIPAAAAYVVEADVDLSAIDWTNIQEGELEAIGSIDPNGFDGGVLTVGVCAASEAIAVDVDAEGWELADFVELGDLVVFCPIDPATVNGGFTTQTASK